MSAFVFFSEIATYSVKSVTCKWIFYCLINANGLSDKASYVIMKKEEHLAAKQTDTFLRLDQLQYIRIYRTHNEC